MFLNIYYAKRCFSVEVKEADCKRLSLTVYPDLRMVAKVPRGCDKDALGKRLRKKASWLAKQLDYFSKFHPITPERKYISGETHYYLGRQYRLKIRKSKNAEIKLKGRYFMVGLPDPKDNAQTKKMMLNWYTEHAIAILNKRIEEYLPRFIKLGAKEPIVKFRRMKKRWGSCHDKGVIVFNLDLVKAPMLCIEYVVVHELCHLLCPRHDEKFYNLLGKILPDWEKRKNSLETFNI